MKAEPKIELVERFFSGTGTTYDRIVKLCTLGFDAWWKKRILEKIPHGPRRIIDQACGTGILTIEIAKRFPGCRVIGVELRDEYLNIARCKVRELKLGNVEFLLGRAEDLLLEGSFDCITSSYLAKYADIDLLVAGAAKMLRSGGTFLAHDFSYPPNTGFALMWEIYFKLLRILGDWKYPEWMTVFAELPEFIRNSDWKRVLVGCLEEKQFCQISVESLTFGASTVVSALKRPSASFLEYSDHVARDAAQKGPVAVFG